MTARALRAPTRRQGLRVVQGRKRGSQSVSPFLVFTIIVLSAVFGIVLARTALDQGAFDLAELERAITEAEAENAALRLEVASLESPIRIAPMAEQLGMVFPSESRPLVVEVPSIRTVDADPRWASIGRYAAVAQGTEADR